MKLRFFGSMQIITLSLFATLALPAWANDGAEPIGMFSCAGAINVMDCIEKSPPPAPEPELPEAVPINTQQFGFGGPFSAGVRYDTDLGWIPEISYTQMFFDNGIHVELGYGAKEQRANVTLGHAFHSHQQIKVTYEYLAQNLPFDFASGTVNEWVSQNAFGAAYRYLFNQALHSIDLNGYYIHANNKNNLADVTFYQNNDAYLNLRRIAGGTEETVTAGITLAPHPQWLIHVGGGYSHLVYDTEYESNQDTTTIAYNAGLDLLITPYTKLSTDVANSAAETDGRFKISQIFPAHIEAAVTGQYSQGQAGQPNSSSITLGLAYPVATYAIAPDDVLGTLKTWIEKPVIRAPRVLAIKDEKITQYAINATNPPAQAVLTGQMIQEIHTQDIFNFDPMIFDQVVYSLAVVNSSNSLYLDIKPDGNSPNNAIIYSTQPLPNATAPNGGAVVYHVTITALGYKNGLATPIQSQADLELDVNFNPSNEPKWITHPAQAIAFDAANPANAINLNQLIEQNAGTAADGVKFAFDNPSLYPNWDITTTGGVWYLVRKPDTNNAFDAGDISTTPKNIMISVQYADDPDGVTIPAQPVSVTVNPDAQINFHWVSGDNCLVNNLTAYQPVNDSRNAPRLLLLSPCVSYQDGNGHALNVKNDNISYPAAHSNDYPGNISVSGSNTSAQLSVGMPSSGLNTAYGLDLTVKSKAQGNNNGIALNVDNLISVGNTMVIDASNQNHLFQEDSSHFITSVVINSLESNHSYTIVSSIPAPSATYTMESPNAITNKSSYDTQKNNNNIVSYPSPIQPGSTGQISIMWWASTGYQTVSSITITQN